MERRQLLNSGDVDTMHSFAQYSTSLGMQESELKELLLGKCVLDIGSGFDGLALEVYRQNIPAIIVSDNPRRELLKYKNERLLSARKFKEQYNISDQRLGELLTQVDQNAASDMAHALSFAEVGKF